MNEFPATFREWKELRPDVYAKWKEQNFPTQEELEELWFTIENMAVISCINRGVTLTPTQLLHKIMEWEHKMLLDPAVSKEARDLIQRGKEEKLLEILAPEELGKND